MLEKKQVVKTRAKKETCSCSLLFWLVGYPFDTIQI